MQASLDIEALNQQIQVDSAFVEEIKTATGDIIVGQEYMIQRLLLRLSLIHI